MNKQIIQENKELIERYPFLLPRNRWTGKVSDSYDYSYTELDAMPKGWKIAFGKQICEEIREELIRANYLDKYRISQIKEKYGSLRWYDFGATEKILKEIIPKYERLSERTCIKCGKPATKISLGWVSPWCDNCADEIKHYERFESADTYFRTCEGCAHYDTDEGDMPCCGCNDKTNFEPAAEGVL